MGYIGEVPCRVAYGQPKVQHMDSVLLSYSLVFRITGSSGHCLMILSTSMLYI